MRKIMILASLSLAPLMASAAIAGPEKPTPAQGAPEAGKPATNDSAVVGKKIAEEWSKYQLARTLAWETYKHNFESLLK